MSDITYRTRADGPGWTAAQIRAELLRIAGGSIVVALDYACHDLAELMKGGHLRPPPVSGAADVKPDDKPPIG